jgi:hypothetical protein
MPALLATKKVVNRSLNTKRSDDGGKSGASVARRLTVSAFCSKATPAVEGCALLLRKMVMANTPVPAGAAAGAFTLATVGAERGASGDADATCTLAGAAAATGAAEAFGWGNALANVGALAGGASGSARTVVARESAGALTSAGLKYATCSPCKIGVAVGRSAALVVGRSLSSGLSALDDGLPGSNAATTGAGAVGGTGNASTKGGCGVGNSDTASVCGAMLMSGAGPGGTGTVNTDGGVVVTLTTGILITGVANCATS